MLFQNGYKIEKERPKESEVKFTVFRGICIPEQTYSQKKILNGVFTKVWGALCWDTFRVSTLQLRRVFNYLR